MDLILTETEDVISTCIMVDGIYYMGREPADIGLEKKTGK